MSNLLLTFREVAQRVGCCVHTIDNWVESGQGPTVTRLGRFKRIREDDYLAWLDQRRVSHSAGDGEATLLGETEAPCQP